MKSKITFKVTVDLKHEKQMPKKEMKAIAKSIIGTNSRRCGSGEYGGYDASVNEIILDSTH